MEQESTKARKEAKCFPSGRFRDFVLLLLPLLTCVVFQFASIQSVKRQIADVKSVSLLPFVKDSKIDLLCKKTKSVRYLKSLSAASLSIRDGSK